MGMFIHCPGPQGMALQGPALPCRQSELRVKVVGLEHGTGRTFSFGYPNALAGTDQVLSPPETRVAAQGSG